MAGIVGNSALRFAGYVDGEEAGFVETVVVDVEPLVAGLVAAGDDDLGGARETF